MSPINLDDPFDFAPPPAYNDSQEFDSKVSLATEISLVTPPAPAPELSEERWAEIEEAAFQAAIAASLSESGQGEQDAGRSNDTAAGPSSPPASPTLSTLPTIQPLRIEKKTSPPAPLKRAKSRPAWLARAEANPLPRVTASTSSSGAYDGDDIAPPPFVAAAPNGTAANAHGYTNYASSTPSTALPNPDHLLPGLDALSISASISQSESNPGSRPRTPVRKLPQPGVAAEVKSVEASFGYYRQSVHTSPAQHLDTHRSEQRPRSELPPAQGAPMLQFNPSVAYGKTAYRPPPLNPPKSPDAHSNSSFESKPEVFRANAFYNAAVSGHISTPQRQSNQRAPSYLNTPSSASSYQTSFSRTSSPQTTYRSFDNPGGMHLSTSYHQGPPMEQRQWQPTYNPTNNRPMSVYSVDTVYSDNGISQQQYLNAVNRAPQQHNGAQGWVQPGGQCQGHYR